MNRPQDESHYELELLRKIRAPTLLIHGEEDNIISVESRLQFLENIADVQAKIYPKVGHLPMYESPNLTAEDIKKFLLEKI